MKKGIFLVANINKCGVESIDNLADRSQINVSHLKLVVHPFGMKFNQLLVLQ